MDVIEIDDPSLVAEALAHPGLRVRPPREPVPAALQGRPTGEVFAVLVRMNDGDFHRQHRPPLLTRVQQWTAERTSAAAVEAVHDLLPRFGPNELLAMVPVQAVPRARHHDPACPAVHEGDRTRRRRSHDRRVG